MVMDAAEPRDYEIRALCMQCGQFPVQEGLGEARK